MTDSNWRQAMLDEMVALQSNGTYEHVPLPCDKTIFGCRWVYTANVGPNDHINKFEALLVAKGYTHFWFRLFFEIVKVST
jgi:hypothetical protein